MVIIGVYAPSNDAIVVDRDEHDELLVHQLNTISNRKEVIILGDFNAHVGSRIGYAIVRPEVNNKNNDNGNRLINICHAYTIQVRNGYYRHKDTHK